MIDAEIADKVITADCDYGMATITFDAEGELRSIDPSHFRAASTVRDALPRVHSRPVSGCGYRPPDGSRTARPWARGVSVPWEYTSVSCDAWLPVDVQGGAEEVLGRLGADGREAYAVTPPTPPPGDGDDPDLSSFDILLKREISDVGFVDRDRGVAAQFVPVAGRLRGLPR